jgi:hypothetical protein
VVEADQDPEQDRDRQWLSIKAPIRLRPLKPLPKCLPHIPATPVALLRPAMAVVVAAAAAVVAAAVLAAGNPLCSQC